MKRKVKVLTLIFVLSIVLISGCSYPKVEKLPKAKEAISTVSPKTNNEEALYGIRLGKTFVTKFYPGAYVDTLTVNDNKEGLYKVGDPTGVIIVNNANEARHYQLTVVQPSQLEDGYLRAPDYVLKEWVRISDPNPTLKAKETKLIPISLWMPPNAEIFAQKWEFQIYIIDTNQTEYKTAYKARWLVEMKK